MKSDEMFKNEKYQKEISYNGVFISYIREDDEDPDEDREITINLFEKTATFGWHVFHESENYEYYEDQSIELNKNEVEAFLELIKELKENGKW